MSDRRASPRFVGEIAVEFLGDGRLVKVILPASFTDSHGDTWYIEPGQIADGASIPRVAWPIVGGPYEGKHRDGALFHDFAYECNGRMPTGKAGEFRTYSRADADRMLLEAVTVSGLNSVTRWTIYLAVRAFGGWAWREDGRANALRG